MARKPALSIETLTELGAEKLARLVFDEAERSAPFRKLVSAALAARKGPEAIAKIIDRRLGALEKARGFIDWDKARAFRDDLAATVATIAGELGDASPLMAAERLLRFIATHEPVFERVDDSSGYVQGVYYDGIAALGVKAGIAGRCTPAGQDHGIAWDEQPRLSGRRGNGNGGASAKGRFAALGRGSHRPAARTGSGGCKGEGSLPFLERFPVPYGSAAHRGRARQPRRIDRS